MRLRYRDIKKIGLMCAAMLFLIGVHVLSVYIFAVHRFTVSYDDTVAEKAQEVIEDYIKVSRLYEERSPEHVAQQLQKQFPFIRKIICAYAPSGLHVHVKTYAPFVQLAKGEVITTNNARVSADYYAQSASAGLPMLHVSLAGNECLPEDMFAYLCSLDQAVIKSGVIRWRHNNEILCDVQGKPMQLICNYQKKPTQELVDHCMMIAQELKDRPILAKGFSADVRFADRIIVAKLRNEGARG